MAKRAFCPYAEQEQHQRNQQHVLAAQRRAWLAAGRHKKADGQNQGEKEGPQDDAPSDGIGGTFVQGLQLELLFTTDPVPLAHDQFAFLDLVIDRLHIGHDRLATALCGLAVERQGCRDRGRQQNVDGPAGVGVQGVFLPEYGRYLGQEGLHVRQRGHLGTQQLGTGVEIADHNPCPARSGRADIPHKAFCQTITDQGHQGLEDILLHFRQGQLGQDFFGHAGRQFFDQATQGGLGRRAVRKDIIAPWHWTRRFGVRGNGLACLGIRRTFRCIFLRRCRSFRDRFDRMEALVISHQIQMPQDPEDTVLEHLIGLHAQVVDRGLEHEYLALAGLAGLHVFHQDVPVGDDVAVGDLTGHIDAAFRRKIGPGQQGQEQQGPNQHQQAATTVMTRSQRLPQGHHA